MLALIPIILSIAPEIGKWLFGDTGEKVGAAASAAVEAITGTPDLATSAQLLSANPQMASDLRVQLAQIAAGEEKAASDAQAAAFAAQIADVANARAQTVALASAHSSVAWGAPVVSLVVLLSFGTALYAVLTKALPPGSEAVANVMLGTLGGMAVAVVSYWVGSSAGSAAKTDMLYHSAPVTPSTTAP